MEKTLRVKIIESSDPVQDISILYKAYRECYSDLPMIDYVNEDLPPYDEQVSFIKHKIDQRHISAIEHVKVTFAIAGVSRSLLAQITRHRHASFSVKSQRYSTVNKNGDFDYVVPSIFKTLTKTQKKYREIMQRLGSDFDSLMELAMMESGKTMQSLKQDVRYVLPNACTTSFVVTMNFSALIHFLGLRLCKKASDEIRRLSKMMLELVQERYPQLFSEVGPQCLHKGYCQENKTGLLCETGRKYVS
jgi:thymidylate synthase (FAD)